MYDLKASNDDLLSDFANGKYENPFHTKNNTFEDLESLIRENRLIESKYNFPYDFTEFIFLDESGNKIDKESHLDSSTIFKREIIKIISSSNDIDFDEIDKKTYCYIYSIRIYKWKWKYIYFFIFYSNY